MTREEHRNETDERVRGTIHRLARRYGQPLPLDQGEVELITTTGAIASLAGMGAWQARASLNRLHAASELFFTAKRGRKGGLTVVVSRRRLGA
jgi:hypothetical protein